MNDVLEKPYRSIREVSEAMEVKAHVLRYWETQFSMLRPRKNRAGVRMYRPKDLELLREIRHLLYDRGFTIAGARRKLLAERKGALDEDRAAEAVADERAARQEGAGRAAEGPTHEEGSRRGRRAQQEFDLGRSGMAEVRGRERGQGLLVREIRRELAELHALLSDVPGKRPAAGSPPAAAPDRPAGKRSSGEPDGRGLERPPIESEDTAPMRASGETGGAARA